MEVASLAFKGIYEGILDFVENAKETSIKTETGNIIDECDLTQSNALPNLGKKHFGNGYPTKNEHNKNGFNLDKSEVHLLFPYKTLKERYNDLKNNGSLKNTIADPDDENYLPPKPTDCIKMDTDLEKLIYELKPINDNDLGVREFSRQFSNRYIK